MSSPKQLTLLAAAGVAVSLFLAQPARALTAVTQSYVNSFDQGRVDAVQPIGHRQWHGYRGGWRGYRRGWRNITSPGGGTHTIAPGGNTATCLALTRLGGDMATIPGVDMSRARIAQRLSSRKCAAPRPVMARSIAAQPRKLSPLRPVDLSFRPNRQSSRAACLRTSVGIHPGSCSWCACPRITPSVRLARKGSGRAPSGTGGMTPEPLPSPEAS
jgi:hypothetical protein